MKKLDPGKEAEKDAAEWLEARSLQAFDFAWHRFPDSRAARGLIGAQPSDFLVSVADGSYHNRTVYLEVKSTEMATRLPKAKVSQYGMLRKFAIIPLTADLTTWFNLALLYPRQGFFAILSANGTPINSIIHICPRNVSPDLYLFQSDTYSPDQMMEILSVVRPHIEFQPLDTLTNTDISQFYETFRSQGTACAPTNVRFQLP